METLIYKSQEELKELLTKKFPEQECVLTTKSVVKCNKKSRDTKEPYEDVFNGEIVCQTTRKVIVGASYKELLYRLGTPPESPKDTDEKPDSLELPWGEWVNGANSLITYKDSYYFRVYGIEKGSTKIHTYADGTVVEIEKIKRLNEFLPPKKDDNQKVIVNNIKLDSIVAITFTDLWLFRKE